MLSLPKDVLHLIGKYLCISDLISLIKTGRKFKIDLLDSKDFWRNKILFDYSTRLFPINQSLFIENPRYLYKLLCGKSKIVLIDISGFMTFDINAEITNHILSQPMPTLLSGDIISYYSFYYRTITNYKIWDGEKVINLYDNLETNGIPPSFKLFEFPPDHFSNTNRFNWLSENVRNMMIENYNLNEYGKIAYGYGKIVSMIYDKYRRNYPVIIDESLDEKYYPRTKEDFSQSLVTMIIGGKEYYPFRLKTIANRVSIEIRISKYF